MPYKYETKNCKHCDYCVKTDKGLYCSHREGHPKVTNGGWCIDMQEKVEKMNNDMISVGTTVHINPEDIKWEHNGGDLISRSALKKSIKSYADDQYAENEYLGEYAIMNIIDNAPAIEYTFEEAFQKTVCENKLYCPNKKPKTEWVWHKGGYYKCANCGEIENAKKNYCSNCGAPMINDGRKE